MPTLVSLSPQQQDQLPVAAAQTQKMPNPLSPRTQQGLCPQVCAEVSPASALPSPGPGGTAVAPQWVLPGGMCGAHPRFGVGSATRSHCSARCAMNSSRVCPQPLGTAHSSLPGCWRNDSTHSPVSHLLFFLILLMSKMTKSKPSAPGPSPCREQEGHGLPGPLPARCWVQEACRQGAPAPRAGCSVPLPGEGTLRGSGERV